MKATGCVRKIDKVGRVVIPKNVLRDLNIKKGDHLNIYISDGNIAIEKESDKDNK